MTARRYEERLLDPLIAELRGKTAEEAAAHLFASGWLDLRACEARAIRAEMARLGRRGVPRCEAMEITAREFCCSYGKVSGIVYNHLKH